MSVIRMTATSGPDGVLHLSVPAGRPGEYEVTVVFVPKPTGNGPAAPPADGPAPKTPEELGWPPGFFENTFGSITDPAFKRYPQGEFEKREPFE